MQIKPTLYHTELNEKGENELIINPHPGQVQILNNDRRFQVMLAGTGGGKTELLPIWVYSEILRCGGGDVLAVSPTTPLQKLRLIPSFIKFFVNTLQIGEYKVADKVMKIKGNTPDGELNANIFFGSADKSESLESMVAVAACIDEAGQDRFKLSAWEAILRRVGHREGRILITTTLYNFGWLKRELYDRWQAGDADINVVQFDSILNPYYSKDEYDRAKRQLPLWKFNMQYRGIFDRPAGQIYQDFDETVHLIEPFPIPTSWNYHVGIDPGAVHTALIWIAEDPATNKFYITNSYLAGNKTTKEHVAYAKMQYEYPRVVDWRGGAGSEQQFRDDWTAEGIPVQEPAIRNVEAMINRVTALWKEKRLYVFNNDANTVSDGNKTRSLLDEIRSFSRELDDNGQPTEKIKDEKTFHFLASLRYFASKISTEGDYSTKADMCLTAIPKVNLTPGFVTNRFYRTGAIPKFR